MYPGGQQRGNEMTKRRPKAWHCDPQTHRENTLMQLSIELQRIAATEATDDEIHAVIDELHDLIVDS